MTIGDLRVLQIMIIELLPLITKIITSLETSHDDVEIKIPLTTDELDKKVEAGYGLGG